jgi:hypothetical protein
MLPGTFGSLPKFPRFVAAPVERLIDQTLPVPFGEPVAVTGRVLHPPFVDPKVGTVTQQSWQDTFFLGVTTDQIGTRLAGWRFGGPEELVPGQWTIQLLLGGKVLAEKAFTVVAAPSNAGPTGGK